MHLFNIFENDKTNWQSKLKSFTETDQSDADKGREFILQVFQNQLGKSSGSIYYMLHDFESYGFKLKDWPEIRDVLEKNKKRILTDLMTLSKDAEAGQYLLDRLYNIGLDWPELDVIKKHFAKSLSTLDESNALISKKIQKILDHYHTLAATQSFSVIPLISDLKAAGIPNSDLKLILRQELPFIINQLKDFKDTRYLDSWVRTLSSINALLDELGLLPVINELLDDLKQYVIDEVQYCLNAENYCNYIPAIINRFDSEHHAEFKQQLKNSVKSFVINRLKQTFLKKDFDLNDIVVWLDLLQKLNINLKVGKFIENILENFANHIVNARGNLQKILSALLMLKDDGVTVRLVDMLNKNKTFILKEIMKNIKVNRYAMIEESKFMAQLEKLGIAWPELSIIKKTIEKMSQP